MMNHVNFRSSLYEYDWDLFLRSNKSRKLEGYNLGEIIGLSHRLGNIIHNNINDSDN